MADDPLILTPVERAQVLHQRERRAAFEADMKRPHWPFVHESATPHRSCGGIVRYTDERNDHADYQCRCDKCGKMWWVEGPDS